MKFHDARERSQWIESAVELVYFHCAYNGPQDAPRIGASVEDADRYGRQCAEFAALKFKCSSGHAVKLARRAERRFYRAIRSGEMGRGGLL